MGRFFFSTFMKLSLLTLICVVVTVYFLAPLIISNSEERAKTVRVVNKISIIPTPENSSVKPSDRHFAPYFKMELEKEIDCDGKRVKAIYYPIMSGILPSGIGNIWDIYFTKGEGSVIKIFKIHWNPTHQRCESKYIDKARPCRKEIDGEKSFN